MVEHEALYRYNTAMKDYFKRYKFEGDRLLGMVFACDIKKALKKYKSYTIIPTPISHEKRQERGFNQVSTILDFAEIKYSSLFQKEDTLAQSKKTREERLKTSQHFQWYLHNGQNNRINEAPTNWKRCERNKDIFNRKVKKDLQKLYESVIIYI